MSKKKKQSKIAFDLQSEMLLRFKPLLSGQDYSRLILEIEKPLAPSLRWNPLKTTADNTFSTWVDRYQWQVTPVPFCPNGYWINESPIPISKTVEHSLGHYYIQDAASMLPVELFQFKDVSQPLILDMAASPGGKTNHLVSRTMDQGLVIANDSSRDRLTALRLVLQNWGACKTAVTNYPGEYFGKWFPEIFDFILLDAPCSMQGLRETDAHSLKPITQKEIETLARRQTHLLESAIAALKIGGQVVYSTCTLTLEENEGVLNSVLERFGSAIQIESVDDILTSPAPGITSYGGQNFDPQVSRSARLWPTNYGTAGFFAARIRKLGIVDHQHKSAPDRPLAQVGWYEIDQTARKKIIESVMQIYGIHLTQILDEYKLQLWQFKNSLHLFPARFIEQFSNLPVQSLGLPLCELQGDEFILSHEFVTRFGRLATSNLFSLEEEQLWTWMRGEDLDVTKLPGNDYPVWIIKDYLQRTIGVGKHSTHRLRNMLPKRILIN
jgi:16S rRNA (cytosine1407-C5)-methyltransferase